ncbi:hypothetical protein EAF00_003552 [Botryotinia globosa]|nr:hypothetical protein EAF00_003552 [Botryotinia globosa]
MPILAISAVRPTDGFSAGTELPSFIKDVAMIKMCSETTTPTQSQIHVIASSLYNSSESLKKWTILPLELVLRGQNYPVHTLSQFFLSSYSIERFPTLYIVSAARTLSIYYIQLPTAIDLKLKFSLTRTLPGVLVCGIHCEMYDLADDNSPEAGMWFNEKNGQ